MDLPKLVITDIDGVWTDGGMYYGDNDLELKKFNTSDSVGVLFLKYLKIPLVILTGENTKIVKKRAKKLKISEVYLGVQNKLKKVEELTFKFGLSLNDVAYIGDDINDIELLKNVGFSACPSSSPEYIKSIVDLVVQPKGGEGAFRSFIEYFVIKNDLLDYVLEQYSIEKRLNQ